MSLVLERRASKDEILELYLNDVYLGQRGSFAIHGVAEAARLFFGKDVANLSLQRSGADCRRDSESRPAVAVREPRARRRAPQRRPAARWPTRSSSRPRRPSAPSRSRCRSWRAPSTTRRRTSWTWSASRWPQAFPGVTAQTGRVDVFTTLDLNLQRAALDAVRERPGQRRQAAGTPEASAAGAGRADRRGSAHRRDSRDGWRALVQPVAVQPRDRGAAPAGFGVQAVRLSSRRSSAPPKKGARISRQPRSPWTSRRRSPSTTRCGSRRTTTPTTARSPGVARWRCRATSARFRSGEPIGFDQVAALWRRVGVGTPPRPFPAITLGVFELTPLEVAQAYTLFVNDGRVRPLTSIQRIETAERELLPEAAGAEARRASRHDVSGHEHDAQRHQRRHRAPAPAPRASRSTPRARPARPTTCATPGSSASRRSC